MNPQTHRVAEGLGELPMPDLISSGSTAGWGSAPQSPGADLWEVISTLPPFISPLFIRFYMPPPSSHRPHQGVPVFGGPPCPCPYLLCFMVEPSPESRTPTSACAGGTGRPDGGTQGVLGGPGGLGAALPQRPFAAAPRGQDEGTGWARPHSTWAGRGCLGSALCSRSEAGTGAACANVNVGCHPACCPSGHCRS